MKQETKHSPAPWHLSIPTHTGKWAGFNTLKGTCYGIYSTNDDLEAIALVPKDNLMVHREQDNLANAKLICAAPDLLEALQEYVKLHKCQHEGETVFPTSEQWIKCSIMAEKAIQKVIGL